MRIPSLAVVLASLTLGTSAWAADPVKGLPPAPELPPPEATYFVSEIRLGVFAHDPWSPENGSADINGEILSIKPFPGDSDLALAIPRLHLGGTVSTVGKTSTLYGGFTWSLDLSPKVFLEASLGGAFNNGSTGVYVPVDRNALGCNWSFRESASLGFRLTEQVSLMGTVEHYSNAGVCDRNRGLTNVGIRLGYSF
jgi:hypothetical protein